MCQGGEGEGREVGFSWGLEEDGFVITSKFSSYPSHPPSLSLIQEGKHQNMSQKLQYEVQVGKMMQYKASVALKVITTKFKVRESWTF